MLGTHGGLSNDPNGTGPGAVAVFLGDSDVERVVSSRLEGKSSVERDLAVPVLIRQPEHSNTARQSARFVDMVFDADLLDGQLELSRFGFKS